MTILIIAITCVVSFMGFSNRSLFEKYKFDPFRMKREGQYYRWITHGFVHADINHLLFNMLSLYFAGQYAERVFAPAPVYVLFYLSALAISALPDYIHNKDNPYYSAIGASGAVSAVLFSLILFEPWGTVYVFFLPIPFIVFAVLYLWYSYAMAKSNTDNIGHWAHITGAIYGIIATLVYRPESLSTFLTNILQPRF
jgi:membrane associated rhomboid family serine protease